MRASTAPVLVPDSYGAQLARAPPQALTEMSQRLERAKRRCHALLGSKGEVEARLQQSEDDLQRALQAGALSSLSLLVMD